MGGTRNSFQAKIASRGYHIYKETTWEKAGVGPVIVDIECDTLSKEIDPYCCSIRVKENGELVTVGHIPREISRHVFFFLSTERGKVDGTVLSTRYKLSPIPAGGLEIPLWLTFRSSNALTYNKIKDFVENLCDYEYGARIDSDPDSDEDTIDLSIECLSSPGESVVDEDSKVDDVELDEESIQPKRKRMIVIEDSEQEIEVVIDTT